MTIEEVQQEKARLAFDIKELVMAFNHKTGCMAYLHPTEYIQSTLKNQQIKYFMPPVDIDVTIPNQ